MTPQELIKITGQHLLFLGISSYSWQLSQFQQAAQFAKSHGVDCLLVKTHDGTNAWYGNVGGWSAVRSAILAEGVGAIPYTYSYGDKFGALDTEIDILIAHMQDTGVVCMDAEAEWNGQTSWAQHLCSRMQPVPGTFLVSTWADPSLQNWGSVIQALAPCTAAFMPQQYNNYLATFWPEFAADGATWLQPTVDLTQEFGANDPVAIAGNAYNQGHTAISAWYYEPALANPGLLDAVYAAFPKTSGGQTVNTYSSNSSDFSTYFKDNGDGTWTSLKYNTVLRGALIAFYQQLSIDGNTLPVPGLPIESEQLHTDSDGYNWWSQECERATLICDPQNRYDTQPRQSYLARLSTKIPSAIIADIKALKAASDKLATDTNVS